ncbi:DUF2283 domain-containing protein [Chroococcidiopsis sp. FACHB-1243]|uniref:DUF2283 domain-containing protein n=1 Tax=Chroococcidiopsis sp. [FACHB-1243] TaxID=2692781 RepID=UPI001786CB02|nr:DUF2283 domain-containing protein [Chroococcidiopsis sp. [FACHB-1243]]MBD2308581.1 DUF2283 domain-containing protein [Chroococcidiopsis sp. [FACHB-1243]]
MKGHYDKETDALAIRWSDIAISDSDEVEPGVILDYDADGNVVGVEILEASRKIESLSGFVGQASV